MKIQFLGAAGTVTGSRNLNRVERDSYLNRLWLVSGRTRVTSAKLGAASVSPSTIDFVLLTQMDI